MSTGIFLADHAKSGIVQRVEDSTNGYTYEQVHEMATGNIILLEDAINPYYFVENSLYQTLPLVTPWRVLRGLLNFDCLSLPAEASISTVKLHLYAFSHEEDEADQSDIHVVEGLFSDPIVTTDYAAIRAAIISGGVAAYPIGAPGYKVIDLNATGLGWITKAGDTLLGIRIQGDISALEPGAESANRLRWRDFHLPGSTQATPVVNGLSAVLSAYQYTYGNPSLEVEYTGADSPAYPRVRFTYYATGEEPYLHKTEWQIGKGIRVTFTADLTSLVPDTTYRSRVETQLVEGGEIWRLSQKTFVTGQVGITINKAYALSREEL